METVVPMNVELSQAGFVQTELLVKEFAGMAFWYPAKNVMIKI